MSNVTDILKEAAKDVLTEETLQAIETSFTESVEQKAEERSKIAVEAALNEQDEKYAEKLQELLESIDKDHCRKLKRVVESVDRDRTNKLKKVVAKYEAALTTEAKDLRNTVVESVSNYLDTYLEEAVPTKAIEEAVSNKKAMGVLSDFRKTLGVDLALANESVRDGIIDGKKQLNESTSKADALAEANQKLKAELVQIKLSSYLAENTKNFDEKKVAFFNKVFEGKSLEFIKENFNYTSRMFDRKEADNTEALKEEAVQESTLKSVEEKELTVESNEVSTDKANPYLNDLSRLYT